MRTLNKLPPEGGRLRARLKVADRADGERYFVHSNDRGSHYAHVLTSPKLPIGSDQLKADRLKAGGIKPGTWALKYRACARIGTVLDSVRRVSWDGSVTSSKTCVMQSEPSCARRALRR